MTLMKLRLNCLNWMVSLQLSNSIHWIRKVNISIYYYDKDGVTMSMK